MIDEETAAKVAVLALAGVGVGLTLPTFLPEWPAEKNEQPEGRASNMSEKQVDRPPPSEALWVAKVKQEQSERTRA